MPSLIGTKSNQVPTVGDLGTLAFQDASNVLVGNINATGVTTVQAGTASAPAITTTGDTNTGIFFPATDTIAFAEGGAEVARFNSSGDLGIGVIPTTLTASASSLQVYGGASQGRIAVQNATTGSTSTSGFHICAIGDRAVVDQRSNSSLEFTTNATERMRLTSDGVLAVGKTSTDSNTVGASMRTDGYCTMVRAGNKLLDINRQTNDGELIAFAQDNTQEGSISVSGTTVSYNGGHLARWSQLFDNSKDESILKGTILSNLDEMCVWEKDGVLAENEQLNKMKVSDVEGDTNVAGVFVNWTRDENYNSDDMNIAMTGDMIIRIAQGVTVQRGDLLMSAGDGTAKPQGDDIVRSKTIAKVTSTNITCTYADGSYCVPCVLMAC